VRSKKKKRAASASRRSPPACELCSQLGGELLWQDAACRVVLIADPDYPGYCRVIWNAHVREMTDLAAAEQQHCMRVVFAVEQALRTALEPRKINLASFGNLTPHLHWHVIPRFTDDPHFPHPVWGERRRTGRQRAAPEAAAHLRTLLAAELSNPVSSRL
jgi:diadenosine tetraphosphate (Ap4A) HIT family hydrolase